MPFGFNSLFGCSSQRKYIDLIYEKATKYANWDPPREIRVGTYGTLDRETGELQVEGNIYDPEFQGELDRQGVKIRMVNFPPKESAAEGNFSVSARVAGQGGLNAHVTADIPNIATASLKGEWQFKNGQRGAVLVMQKPRLVYLPPDVILEKLYDVDKLIDKYLITSVHMCPAYSLYLSNTSGHKFSLALVAKAPIAHAVGATAGGGGGFEWQDKTQGGLHRNACDSEGRYVFTPLYALKRPIKRDRKTHRDNGLPEPAGDNLWYDASPPWDPLDEEGAEDPIEPDN